MKTSRYHSYDDGYPNPSPNSCSRAISSAPLIVNCAGSFSTQFPFTTDNPTGRLDYYLMHISSGSLNIKTPYGITHASIGDTVILPPDCPYSYTFKGDEELCYLWVHFTGSAAQFYLEKTGMFPLPFVRRSSPENRIAANFRAMFDTFAGDDTLREHALAACLLQILTEISRSHQKSKESPIIRSLRFIDSSYTEPIHIPDLAAMENLSNSRYCVIFKQVTGKSPSTYIMDKRLRHACELLRTTDMSIKQIGTLVGYRDPLFFSKLFKSKLGVSPTEYRKS